MILTAEKPELRSKIISPSTELEIRLLTIPLRHLEEEELLRGLVGLLKKYLTSECFRYELHRKIFDLLVKLYDKRALNGLVLSQIVASLIDSEDDILIKETCNYVINLCNYELPLQESHTIQLEHLCKIMSEHFAKFKMAQICYESMEIAQTPENVSYEIKKELLDKINCIRLPIKSTGQSLKEAVFQELDCLYEDNNTTKRLITTGFKSLDNIIEGIDCNTITGLLGNRGEGKSTFMLQVARNIVIQKPDEEVILFSLEMSISQVLRKLVIINSNGLINPFKKNEKFRTEYPKELEKIYKLPIFIIERLTPNTFDNIQLAIEARKAESNKNISAIIIDHWHLINFYRKGLSYTEAQNQCVPLLNDIAKEYNTRIFVVTQRDKESRKTKKRPQMDEVKGTSDLGDICHNFISIYRPDAGIFLNGIEECKVYVDKSRFGPSGQCEIGFNTDKVIFEDIDSFTQGIEQRWGKR